MRRLGSRRFRWGAATVVVLGVVAFVNHLASPAPQEFRTPAGVKMPGYSLRGALEQPTNSDITQVVRALDTRAQRHPRW